MFYYKFLNKPRDTRSLRIFFNYGLGQAFSKEDLVSHVIGYPSGLHNRLYDGHRHITITTRPQPLSAGLRTRLYARLCAGLRARPCARLYIGTFNYRNPSRAFSPKALLAALNPLAPTATPFLWPSATLSSWSTSLIEHG